MGRVSYPRSGHISAPVCRSAAVEQFDHARRALLTGASRIVAVQGAAAVRGRMAAVVRVLQGER
jgi:hypothetical protein